MNDLDNACKYFKKDVLTGPKETNLYLGKILMRKGELKEAKSHFEYAAIRRVQEGLNLYINICQKLGQDTEVEELLDLIEEIESNTHEP